MTNFFIPRGLKVREVDSSPSVITSELVFTNGSLSVAGSVVTVQSSGVTDGDKGDITVSASGATWTIDNDAPSIANKVVGPASSTDNAVARFDATTGKLIQDSSVVVTDDGFVGIGTNSPDRKLVIDGSTGSPGLSVRHTARSGSGLDISSGNNRSSIFNSDAVPLRLGVSSTTAININSTNVVTFPEGVELGTPISGVATNLTGTASGLTAGNVTTNANLTGHVTSVGNAAVLGSFTKAQLDAAVSDGNVLYVGDVTSNATHTGDVTGATALTIANAAVTLAKMANLEQDQFIGRTTASTGVPETATITAAARTVLDDATVAAMVDTLGGASSTGTGGLVRATSPTLVTPNIGAASGTSLSLSGGGILQVGASDARFRVDSTKSNVYINGGVNLDGPVAQLSVVGRDSPTPVAIFRGAVSQTASLTDWQNSGGTVVASISPVGNLTASGTISSTANGAASTPASTLVGTWFTGGSSTTTKPQLLVEPTGTTSTGWSTSGTGIGVNSPGAFLGNLLDLQKAGVSRFSVSDTGGIITNGGTATLPTGTTNNQLIGNTLVQGRFRVHTNASTGTLAWDFANFGDQHLISEQNTRVCQSITQNNVATAHYGFASNSTAFVIGSDGASISFRQSPTATLAAGTERLNLNLSTGLLATASITASGTVTLGTYTVGTLPSASANTRAIAYVTDSNVGTFGAVASAGGSLGVTVYSNGTNWLVSGGSVQPQKTITSGTAAPSGGVDGDIYLQYT
jgi:hypothetical protein